MASLCVVTFAAAPTLTKTFQQAVLEWVADFEATYSRFIPESLISQINAKAGREWIDIDSETEHLLSLCQEAFVFTRGVFEPTALPLIELWNWKSQSPVIPTDAAIDVAKSKIGWSRVQRSPGKIFLPEGMSLDLGGIGKEYAVDKVAELASQHGIHDILIDFGRDILALGVPPHGAPAWHIGLDDPNQPGKCWVGLRAKDVAIATSGDYIRRFEVNGRRYGHIIDIRTGYPVANGLIAVSIIAPRCTVAGMLATTVFILGPGEGVELLNMLPGVAGAIVTNRSRVTSRNFYEYIVSGG